MPLLYPFHYRGCVPRPFLEMVSSAASLKVGGNKWVLLWENPIWWKKFVPPLFRGLIGTVVWKVLLTSKNISILQRWFFKTMRVKFYKYYWHLEFWKYHIELLWKNSKSKISIFWTCKVGFFCPLYHFGSPIFWT